jgi:hypothetical protein
MDLVPKRTFLFKQNELEGGKKKDVIAKQGVLLKGVTEREAVKFWGSFELDDNQKKKLIGLARANGWTRLV